jgi:signal transduction histidine kinase
MRPARLARIAVAWLLPVVAAIVFALAFAAPAAEGTEADGVRVLMEAQFCGPLASDDTAEAPPATCAWRTVPLAKVWSTPNDAGTSDAWIRVHFRLDREPARPLAVYLVGFNRTGRLYVNDRLLREFGAMQGRLPMNWNRAQFATLPAALLHAGDNALLIQQRIYFWERGVISPVRIGPQDTLRPMYERRRFVQNDLVRILGATTGVVGIFMLGVWLGRRDRAMYLWFGINCLVWTAISLDYYALYPPLPAAAWEDFIEMAQVLRGVTMYVFVLRYAGRRAPWFEAAMWAYFGLGAIGVASNLLSGEQIDWWYLVTLLPAPYFCWVLVRAALREHVLEGVLYALATGVQFALSAYDLWRYSLHYWVDLMYVSHFSVALVLLVVAWGLMRRFVESLSAYERLAAVLEERVADKASELKQNYEALIEARRNEALALERTRIMSEMHDGIGSQLTMALSLVREAEGDDGRVARVLRESIEDLQLIIDSLEPVENDLLTVLGTLRYRLQGRLSQSGIALQWNVVDLPPLPMLTPHSVLSILRILQEAFANCIKHSGARTIVVSTELAGTHGVDETARIRIVDDGDGFRPKEAEAGVAAPEPRAAAAPRRGRGLDNMARRAAALGARLEITSVPGRTEVMLAIPTMRS